MADASADSIERNSMPLKTVANPDLITFVQAKAVKDALVALGVPCGPLFEQDARFNIVSTEDPNWIDDGGTYIYSMSIWGTSLDVSLVKATLTKNGVSGGFNNFMALLEQTDHVFQPGSTPEQRYATALGLIMGMNGIMGVVNSKLAVTF